MQRRDVQAWFDAWEAVARAEIAAVRELAPEVKLRQVDALAASASLFTWPNDDEEDERVRELWNALRRRSGIR